MLTAHDPKELSNIVEAIKKEAKWKGISTGDKAKIFGATIDFGSKNETDTKYAWMNHHGTVKYNDELLDIKVASTFGNLLTANRCLYEKWFNQEYLTKESPSDSKKREIKVYEYLNNQKFPTLETVNHNFPAIEDAVITRKITGAKPAIDIIINSSEKYQQRYIGDIALQMKKMHDLGVIWGDAWLGNAMYDGNKLLLYDFGLKPNPSKSKEFLVGKEIIALCMSATFRTGQSAKMMVPAVIEAYELPTEVLASTDRILYENAKQNHGPIVKLAEEILYFNPVFGMNRKDVEKVKEEIRRNIK